MVFVFLRYSFELNWVWFFLKSYFFIFINKNIIINKFFINYIQGNYNSRNSYKQDIEFLLRLGINYKEDKL